MLIFLFIVILIAVGILLFFQQPKFGKAPSGVRLRRIKASPHFRKGSFQNLSPTPGLTEGVSYGRALKEFFLDKKENKEPVLPIPSVKTDLKNLPRDKDVLIWFGHSSYFMQIDGRKILVDPVLSGYASPFSFTTRAFKGTDIYKPADIPAIDYLLLTHDHWDHLDYAALRQIRPGIKMIICPLGTGEHLESWGFDHRIIREMDWNEEFIPEPGFRVHAVPARHFSGRTFRRNKTLWTSFAFLTPKHRIFIGGDSGYDTHFKEAGQKFGFFDLAILENGQYDKNWKYIHMMPDEVLLAARDLNAKRLFPVHSSKFALANHSWDDPLEKISRLNQGFSLLLVTPVIGEPVDLNNPQQSFTQWWKPENRDSEAGR